MKTEIPQWILNYKDEPSHGYGCEAVETLLAIIEKLESGKPDWDDAPEWAEWLAQDADGSWWWYESQPQQGSDEWSPMLSRFYKPHDAIKTIDWKNTMEKRPTHEK